METIKKFLTDFKSSFRGNAYISNYTSGQATGEFLKLFFAPFYLSMIISFVMLATGEKWDAILFKTIKEFMQLTGIKLSFYSVMGLIGFSFLFYKIRWLTQLLSWLVKSISHAAFAMSAVLTGVIWGIVIPSCIDAQNYSALASSIFLSIITILLAILFFLSAKVFSTSVREEIDKSLGKHTRKITVGFGLFLIILVIKTMIFEETWKIENSEPKNEQSTKHHS